MEPLIGGRKKVKERIKSFILILLVLCSVGLTSVTWMEERLWPEGYSLFANFKTLPIIRNFFGEMYSEPLENLKKARKIVIADGNGKSSVFYNSDKAFDDVYSDIGTLINGFMSGEIPVSEQSLLTRENLRQMLNEQVMYAYVSYPVASTPQLFGRLMGVSDSESLSGVSAVRDFFILPTGSESLELLAVDYEGTEVYRYELSYGGTDRLISSFTSYVANVDLEHNCMLALEMNLDIADGNEAVKMKTVLDSFLVLDSASTATNKRPEITGHNPLGADSGAAERAIERFGYNPESIHRYVDGEGTRVYLENDSMLKIYRNGIIEYEATDPEHGILLSGDGSLYESLNSAIRFAGDVYSSSSGADFKVNVSGDLLYEPSGVMTFVFDYYFSGTPVTADISLGTEKMEHAIEITVEGGYITKFKMLVREYEETGNDVDMMTVYEAIDKIALMYSESTEPIHVADIFMSYAEDGKSGIVSPVWTGYADGGRIIIRN